MEKTILEQYAAAAERAAKKGILVIAHGARKADGVEYYVTNSASASDGGHTVTVTDHLECDCPARVICTHKAVVRAKLLERSAAKVAAMRDERLAQAQAEARAREAAIPAYRNNKAFSLFKS